MNSKEKKTKENSVNGSIPEPTKEHVINDLQACIGFLNMVLASPKLQELILQEMKDTRLKILKFQELQHGKEPAMK